jgi:membrane associated rhomboid family serine protease
MIPLRDIIPSRTTPYITITIIVLNALAWLFELALPRDFLPVFLQINGVVAADFRASSLITSMFLHGSWSHVIGNMWYLWIFGDNVEDTLGHGRFLVFYLLSGIAAALVQTMVSPASEIPMLGASGAVSGVLGAYLLLFPHARVLTLLIFGFFFRMVHIPAVIVLGFWIIVQFVNGLLTVTISAARGESTGGGVAWFAHIGGFVAGMALLFVLRPRRDPREPY